MTYQQKMKLLICLCCEYSFQKNTNGMLTNIVITGYDVNFAKGPFRDFSWLDKRILLMTWLEVICLKCLVW